MKSRKAAKYIGIRLSALVGISEAGNGRSAPILLPSSSACRAQRGERKVGAAA